MSMTPNLGLPELQASQAQKHVTMNEALRLLDGLVQLSVKDRDLAAPPGSPVEGDRYLVAGSATGAWTGWEGSIAVATDGLWTRLIPKPGWRVWVEDEKLLLIWDGSIWADVIPTEFQNLGSLGVNASADTTNRLTVASDAVLLTHAGSGMQMKLNKNAPGDTASLLYQSGWSGRAEIGLAGGDDGPVAKVLGFGRYGFWWRVFELALPRKLISGAISPISGGLLPLSQAAGIGMRSTPSRMRRLKLCAMACIAT